MSITVQREVRFVLTLPDGHKASLTEEEAATLAAQLRGLPTRGGTGRPVRWTEQRLDEVRRRFTAGETDAQMAEPLGVSVHTIEKVRASEQLRRGEAPAYQRQRAIPAPTPDQESPPHAAPISLPETALATAVREGRALGWTSKRVADNSGFAHADVNAEWIRQDDHDRHARLGMTGGAR